MAASSAGGAAGRPAACLCEMAHFGTAPRSIRACWPGTRSATIELAFLPQGFKTLSPRGDVEIVLVDPAIHCVEEGFFTDTNLAAHGGFEVRARRGHQRPRRRASHRTAVIATEAVQFSPGCSMHDAGQGGMPAGTRAATQTMTRTHGMTKASGLVPGACRIRWDAPRAP